MARIAHKEGAAVLKHLKEQEPPRLDDGTAAEQPGLEQWTAWNAAVVQDEESVLKLKTKLDEIKKVSDRKVLRVPFAQRAGVQCCFRRTKQRSRSRSPPC